MSNRTELWIGAHLAMACDMGVDIQGNECEPHSVLMVLHELFPEFKGCKPTHGQMVEHGIETYGWSRAEALESMGEG